MTSIFACPKCRQGLAEHSATYTCPLGHSFDKAASGYVNLLQPKESHAVGDNKEMISARRHFLSGGWYLPLRDTLSQMMKQVLPQGGVWLDAGCGEGWYAEGICQALSEADNPVFCFGVDISKDALKYAAKRQVPSMRLAVGSVYHMPVLDHSCDAVLNVFAPLVPDVYQRILKKGGHLLLAVPHTTHLWGLKEVLYDTPYPNPVSDTHLDGFALIEEQMVQSRITLTQKEDIQSLFVMTPYAYRTGEGGRQRLLALDHLETEISFKVLLYQLAF